MLYLINSRFQVGLPQCWMNVTRLYAWTFLLEIDPNRVWKKARCAEERKNNRSYYVDLETSSIRLYKNRLWHCAIVASFLQFFRTTIAYHRQSIYWKTINSLIPISFSSFDLANQFLPFGAWPMLKLGCVMLEPKAAVDVVVDVEGGVGTVELLTPNEYGVLVVCGCGWAPAFDPPTESESVVFVPMDVCPCVRPKVAGREAFSFCDGAVPSDE